MSSASSDQKLKACIHYPLQILCTQCAHPHARFPPCRWDKLDDFFGSTQMKTVMDGLTLPATNDMGPGPAHIERQTSDHTLQHLWTGPQLTAASITWEPCDPAWGCLEQNFGTDAAMRWETVLGVIKKLFSQVPDD